jgi:DJ-1/PfpI family
VAHRNRTAHLGLYDTLADWEVGHLLAELRSGRFTGVRFDVISVAESLEPITTMGGVRMLPDALITELDPTDSDLLILPGAEMWDIGGGAPFADAARRFLDARVPVAAICGATAGPQSPVQFACAALRRLGLASSRTLDAYERLFGGGDVSVPGSHGSSGRQPMRSRACP